MASLITVRISKGDSPNLGFRLQGGKDFATPLVIQKVNVGSPAERAGLVAGDSVIKINDTDVFNLRHKDAQDVVVRAGPAFEITLQRGGSTWKPSVIPTGSFPTPSPVINNVSPVTRTSLTAPKGENIGAIGTGHNLSAKPFSPQVNGTVNGGPKVVNKQYNSPLKLYSEESIAETLSAQTEVLSTGALGVNFKKNEKNYDASNSAVLRMLQESENEPRTADEVVRSEYYSTQSHAIGGRKTVTPSINVPLDDRSRSSSLPGDPPKPNNPTEGVTVCTDCERVIVGVFVRIKDKNLHVECFKCATCGTSLKNVGYYNINNKLYCDIHAKSAAIRINANPNLVPVTVPPGGKPPVQAISSALASHSLPTSSPLSPKINNSFSSPYQPQETNENADVSPPLPNLSTNVTSEANNNNNSLYNNSAPLSFSKYLNKSSTSFSGPKPFSSVSAPLSPPSTLPRAAPLSPITPTAAPSYNAPSYNAPSYSAPSYKAPSYSPASSAGRFSSVKPAGGLFKGAAGGRQAGGISVTPKRGRGVLNTAAIGGARVPLCGHCNMHIRGPFITALGKIWCPNHFICTTPSCRRPLQDLGFVEERGQLYCEFCFEQYLAPPCAKCSGKIKGDCLKAIGKNFHPECFNCVYCGKLFGNSPFFLEDGSPYCEADWNELFTTKCFACGFPVEAGDRWVEALNNNYHSQCFNCTMCKKNLEGQSFFAKGGRPFCKNHAR
ncbi:PDZ and LIM domain protein Zasp isoform X5 [Anoplophora glabripennis]|uniref:PDZ and LIM domain protein Zasp isoform X5 n=1 Tax=Anoplophora glabripennis TaxID=217634 RepID=UPI0008738062|nr:PDZ and LIM domain protein Zasp isoform X5 [Anoplophora glabripennis]